MLQHTAHLLAGAGSRVARCRCTSRSTRALPAGHLKEAEEATSCPFSIAARAGCSCNSAVVIHCSRPSCNQPSNTASPPVPPSRPQRQRVPQRLCPRPQQQQCADAQQRPAVSTDAREWGGATQPSRCPKVPRAGASQLGRSIHTSLHPSAPPRPPRPQQQQQRRQQPALALQPHQRRPAGRQPPAQQGGSRPCTVMHAE